MSREWGIRTPDSEQKQCPQCKTMYWTTGKNQKYCSPECRIKHGTEKAKEKYSYKSTGKQYDYGSKGEFEYDKDLAALDLDKDDQWAKVKDETPEILDMIAHNDLVGAKYAELTSEPNELTFAVRRLEHAIDTVNPNRIQEMINDIQKTKRNGTYNWEQLFDGEIHVLKHGVDYYVSENSVRINIYRQASKRGLKVKVTPMEGGIVLQRKRLPGEGGAE